MHPRALLPTLLLACLAAGAPATRNSLQDILANGDSSARGSALRQLLGQRTLDDSYLEPLRLAATDTDAGVRAEVARVALRQFIWSAKTQNPRAIELAIALAEDSDPNVVHNAVYFGLSTVREPSDEVLACLAKVAASAKRYDPTNLHGRIAWGWKSVSHVPAERLVAVFKPYWADVEGNPKAALFLGRLFKEATGQDPPDAAKLAGLEQRVEEIDAAARRQLLADNKNVLRDLENGPSGIRMDAIRKIYATPDLEAALDGAAFRALLAAGTDRDAAVKKEVARIVGTGWAWAGPAAGGYPARTEETRDMAIELLCKLARDRNAEVRYASVYYGLSTARPRSDDVVQGMIDAAVTPGTPDPNLWSRVAWSLKGEPADRLLALFKPYFGDADMTRAINAAVLYYAVTKRPAPDTENLTKALTTVVQFAGNAKTPQSLAEAFRAAVPADLYTELLVFDRQSGLAITTGLTSRQALVGRLAASKALRPSEDFVPWTPEIETRARRMAAIKAAPTAQDGARVAANNPTYARAFQDLYTHIGRVYPCFEMKGIDWKRVGDELLPRAATLKGDDEFALLCLELIARMEDSHAQLLEASAKIPEIPFPNFDPGLACVIDDHDRPVIYHVDPNSPAERAGIHPGLIVVSVNDVPAERAMTDFAKRLSKYSGYSSARALRYDAAKMFIRTMDKDAIVELVLQSPDEQATRQRVELRCSMPSRYLPRLPVPIEGINDSADVSWKMLDNDTGYIYVRRIKDNLIDDLDRATQAVRTCRGLIIDVRGNSGGGFDANRSFRNFDAEDKEEPKRPRFTGPIALLIDERTISAGEGWSSWFVARKRARLFGTATSGASSRKETYTLTNGLFQAIIPVKAYTGFLDRPIERRGLEPDVPVRVKAVDLANGRDTVLEAAKQYLSTAK